MFNGQETMSSAKKFLLFTVSLVGAYWATAQFHASYCAPPGFWGFVNTPITMGSPLCIGATEVLSKTSQVYAATWLGVIGMGVSCMWDKCAVVGGRKLGKSD